MTEIRSSSAKPLSVPCFRSPRVDGPPTTSDLGEDAVGFLDDVLVDGVGGGGVEVDADGAAEDEDGDEAAEEGDLDVVEGLLEI